MSTMRDRAYVNGALRCNGEPRTRLTREAAPFRRGGMRSLLVETLLLFDLHGGPALRSSIHEPTPAPLTMRPVTPVASAPAPTGAVPAMRPATSSVSAPIPTAAARQRLICGDAHGFPTATGERTPSAHPSRPEPRDTAADRNGPGLTHRAEPLHSPPHGESGAEIAEPPERSPDAPDPGLGRTGGQHPEHRHGCRESHQRQSSASHDFPLSEVPVVNQDSHLPVPLPPFDSQDASPSCSGSEKNPGAHERTS